MLQGAHREEYLLQIDFMRQVQVLLELMHKELDEGADHGPDLVVKLEGELRGLFVRLAQLGLV